jgi:biotin carboxyl carrier protein
MSTSQPNSPRPWSAPTVTALGVDGQRCAASDELEKRLTELDHLATGESVGNAFWKKLLDTASELTTAKICRLWQKAKHGSWERLAQHGVEDHASNSASSANSNQATDPAAPTMTTCWDGLFDNPFASPTIEAASPQFHLEASANSTPPKAGCVIWQIEDGTAGVLELTEFMVDSREQTWIQDAAIAIAEIAAEDQRRRRLRSLPNERERWETLWNYAQRLQQCTSRVSLMQTIVEELRRLTKCDRVALITTKNRARGAKPRHWKVAAVSGATTVAKQSDLHRHLKQFAATNGRVPASIKCGFVPAEVERVVAAEKSNDDDARLNSWWHDYSDATASQGFLAVSWQTLALHHSANSSAQVELPVSIRSWMLQGTDDETTEKRSIENHALVIFEWFKHDRADSLSAADQHSMLPLVIRSTAEAIEQRNRVDQLPGVGVMRRLAVLRRTWWSVGLTWTRVAMLALVGIVLAMIFVQVDFNVSARGTVWPQNYQEIFASEDGIVESVELSNDLTVDKDRVVIRMQNPMLDQKKTELDGEIATMDQKLKSLRAEQLDVTRKEDLARDAQISAEEAEIQKMMESRLEQRKILAARLANMKITAPFSGKVLTWNAKARLQGRPVKQGDALLTIAEPSGTWRADLRLSETNATYVPSLNELRDNPAEVELRLATAPETKICATLHSRAIRSETDPTWGTGIRSEAELKLSTDELNSALDAGYLTPGTEVNAKIPCGKLALGFVLFHDVWDAWRRWW